MFYITVENFSYFTRRLCKSNLKTSQIYHRTNEQMQYLTSVQSTNNRSLILFFFYHQWGICHCNTFGSYIPIMRSTNGIKDIRLHLMNRYELIHLCIFNKNLGPEGSGRKTFKIETQQSYMRGCMLWSHQILQHVCFCHTVCCIYVCIK